MRFLVEQFVPNYGGVNLWRTRDGVTWEAVTKTGFGNHLNLGVRTMHSTPSGLFVTVGNPFGPEVAVKRAAGWTFEHDEAGGAQVWLGAEDSPESGEAAPPELSDPDPLSTFELPRTAEELIDGFYAGSGYRHAGSWTPRTRSAKDACDNLMGEVLACLPEKQGTVIDIGCGQGGTTACLRNHFAPEDITGVCAAKEDLPRCEARVPGARFFHGALNKLPVEDRSHDFAIAVETPAAPVERAALFSECARILRPAGRVVVVDILRVSDLLNANNYAHLLERCGFSRVQVFDLTAPGTRHFSREVTRHFRARVLLNEISNDRYEEIRAALPGANPGVSAYLLATAVRGAE